MGDDERRRSRLMRRSEIRWVDFDPVEGAEAAARRPAVIVSNDGANRTASTLGRGVITVVPVTSNVSRLYPFQVLLPSARCGLETDSKAQAEQVRSISVGRLADLAGAVPPDLMSELDEALRLHLDL